MVNSYQKAIENRNTSKSRIWELDFLRGICLILMIFDHLMYNIATTFSFINATGVGRALTTFAYTYTLSGLRTIGWPIAVGVFVLLCGISTGLSRNNLLRGLRLVSVAYAITFILTLSDTLFNTSMAINFGILHTLAFSILVYTLTTGGAKRIKLLSYKGVTISLQEVALAVLGIISIYLTISYCVPLRTDSLNPAHGSIFGVSFSEYYYFSLGINNNLLLSTDYIPLLPWIGIFAVGAILSIRLYPDKKSLFPSRESFVKSPLAKLGRKSLLVYVIHQPIIYILLGVISLILTGRFI